MTFSLIFTPGFMTAPAQMTHPTPIETPAAIVALGWMAEARYSPFSLTSSESLSRAALSPKPNIMRAIPCSGRTSNCSLPPRIAAPQNSAL